MSFFQNRDLLPNVKSWAKAAVLSSIMTTEILLFGAGAIGAFYASRLALNKGVLVSAICRSNYQAVKANGFKISSPQFGESNWRPKRTFPNSSEARSSGVVWDFVIVSTKALPDVSDDSELLEGLIRPQTAVVLIQNGLGVEKPYADRFPEATILSAVTIASCAQPEHGHIVHNRWTRINSGPYPSSEPRALEKSQTFIDMLANSGIKDASAYSAEKMQLLRWHKIAINAAMNPSSVLSGGTDNASMAKDPDIQEHLRAVMDEILTVAPKITGEPLPDDFATAEQIVKSTQKNPSGSKPSMQLDWEGGKKMELEVILGNPIRMAKEKGFDLPRMQTMYALLKMAQRNRDNGVGNSKL